LQTLSKNHDASFRLSLLRAFPGIPLSRLNGEANSQVAGDALARTV
jgi:hypothetical protein